MQNPVLKYSYHAEFLEGDKVLLNSEKDCSLLSGKAYYLVLWEICREKLSLPQLVDKLAKQLSAWEIYYVLQDLEKKGFLTEAVPREYPETCAYWNSQGIEVNSLRQALQEKTATVETIEPLTPEVFLRAFMSAGINTNDPGQLKIIITDDYQREELRRLNREFLAQNQPWMLVKPVGVELWLGPIFVPGKTGCWECLKQRLEINRPGQAFYQGQKNTPDFPRIPIACVPSTFHIAAYYTVLEVMKWFYRGENKNLEGKIISIDTHSLTHQSHTLVKRPQCKTCGETGCKVELLPIILPEKSTCCDVFPGGYREIPPEETLEKYEHHVSPITGIMPLLQPYHGIKGTPIFNYSSGRNTALRSKTLFWMNQHLRSGNGGKGRSWIQAKTGALCEAVERYSMTYHGHEPYIVSSLKALGSSAIHPNTCMNYSEAQYRNRDEINRDYTKFYNLVPVPFDSSREMPWTPVYSLTYKDFKYLPDCYCYAQYPAEDERNLFAYPDSNGCAAGNSMAEAILQGFLELVERDGAALWWYNRLPKPMVDIAGFNDPYFNRLTRYYQSLGRRLYVLDLTTDLQIPIFAAISHRLQDEKQDIIFGFGAHLDAHIAMERALLELNQLLPITGVPGRTPGQYLTKDKTFIHWLNTATVENQPHLAPLDTVHTGHIPVKEAADFPCLCEPNIHEGILFCLDTAAKHGLETLVLDLTQPDIGLKVVKVIVPGLRHFWRRLAPGRLYDIPYRMGWLTKPLKEDELNPLELFI